MQSPAPNQRAGDGFADTLAGIGHQRSGAFSGLTMRKIANPESLQYAYWRVK
jgi:hypothetical protein